MAAMAEFQPLLTMSWGSDLLVKAKRSPWMRYITQFTLSRTKLLLADCQTVADEAMGYGFPQERIIQFPWGVDLDHFSPENGQESGRILRHALGWEDKFVLMCNRAWSPLYGVDVLAKAFTSAAQEGQNLRLLLIGDGPQSQMIREILSPVVDKVSLPGWVGREDLPGAYCAADLFISPSHSDGSSISLLEAMACARPVLVSDIPSNQEWVQPGLTGALFEDGRVNSLEEMILQLAFDLNLNQYGLEARKVAEKRADWSKNFRILVDGYRQVLV
jgi:glycosyltransferase involved in cell wall biosynthesis